MDIANPKLKLRKACKPLRLVGGGAMASALIAGTAAWIGPALLGVEES